MIYQAHKTPTSWLTVAAMNMMESQLKLSQGGKPREDCTVYIKTLRTWRDSDRHSGLEGQTLGI